MLLWLLLSRLHLAKNPKNSIIKSNNVSEYKTKQKNQAPCLVSMPKGSEDMYTAMNIASEVILQYKQRGGGISNLKLQKVLYYAQMESLQKNNRVLFDDDIEAWRHGPVVPSVYFSYRRFISSKIDPEDRYVKDNATDLDMNSKSVIRDIVEKSFELDPWEMVEKTHKTIPWSKNYIAGANTRIPIDEIKREGTVNLP